MAIHSSILAWRIPWTEEPGGVTVHGVTKSRTWLSNFTHCRNRSDMPVAWTSCAHGKTDLHFTEASRRHSGRMGTAPAASDLHLVNGSAAQTEGRKGIRNSLFPWETSQRASVLGQAIPAPAGRFHTLCCWKTFYTLLPSVMSWLVYPSYSDVKVLQYFRTWPYVDTGSMQM